MKVNVIYYADEPREHEKDDGALNHNRETKHTLPIADLFFITKDNKLVLIDLTGGGKLVVSKKYRDKVDWMKSHGNKGKKMALRDGTLIEEVHCVILAPNIDKIDETFDMQSSVKLIYGEEAISLLGGLEQIAPWLMEANKWDVM